MQRLIAGIKDGKSCIVRATDYDLSGPDIAVEDFISFPLNPPPTRPAGKGFFHDVGVPLGTLLWRTIHFPPNCEFTGTHHSDSIDCHTILTGKLDLILDDGVHSLFPGDFLALPGVDHNWRTGVEGATSSLFIFGTPPRDD